MKNKIISTVAFSALISSAGGVLAQNTLQLDFAALPGSTINFNFSQQDFFFSSSSSETVSPGSQWVITDEQYNGALVNGPSVGLDGSITPTGGAAAFSYGAVTAGPMTYSANVIGPSGLLSIGDSNGGTLTGTVDFIDVSSYGKIGALNATAQINLRDVVYSGTNPDLQFLTANAPGTLDMSFQAILLGSSSLSTSYSGSILVAAVPEPSSMLMSSLGGLGALGFAILRRKNA